MQFYDIHSHILPNIDDGAKSVEESLELINCLKTQNVKNISFTPHYYTNEISQEDFLQQRHNAFNKLKSCLPNDVNAICGAEVYVTKFLTIDENIKNITYGNSNYILTEFPYNTSFSDNTMDYLFRFMNIYNLTPIIPHIERYPILLDNPSVIKDLKSLGILMQTNVASYTKKSSFTKKRTLIKLINNNLIDLLGTDAHSMTHGSPLDYSKAVEYITKKCGADVINQMMDNAKQIFEQAK